MPLTAEIVELPAPAVSVTVLPETAVPPESFSVTLMVDVVLPSAATLVGAAETVDWVALTVGGAAAVNVTAAVCVTSTESVVSCAVYVTVSAVASFTVNVATPEPFVVPPTVEIVELPLRRRASRSCRRRRRRRSPSA